MNFIERQGIIVWVYTLKPLKQLKRYGLIHYVSRRMKYVVLYVNQSEVNETEKKLKQLHFVRKVEVSHRPEINMDFDHALDELQNTEQTEERSIERENIEK